MGRWEASRIRTRSLSNLGPTLPARERTGDHTSPSREPVECAVFLRSQLPFSAPCRLPFGSMGCPRRMARSTLVSVGPAPRRSAGLARFAVFVVVFIRRSVGAPLSPTDFPEDPENNRCSTLFHLLVPGGKWQTLSTSPVWSASRCNSHFRSRRREPLLPPPSAVISSRPAPGYRRRPSARHQPRI